jgi:hypothetical protein
MASSRDIKAGGAHVELSIRDKLAAGLQRAAGKLKAFGAGVKAIGTSLAGLGPIIASSSFGVAAKLFADAGSEIYDMSKRTGLAADNLSELKYAADQTGTSIDEVERSIRFMQKQGIDASRFDELLASVSEIANESERVQVAMKLWGKGGVKMLPMAGEIAALRNEAKTLGVSMSPGRAALADEMGDAFGRLKTAILGIAYQIAADLAPTIIDVTNAFITAAIEVRLFAAAVGEAAGAFREDVAHGLLEGSTGGGLYGVLSSAILGVDVADEIRKNNEMDAARGVTPQNILDEVGHGLMTQLREEANRRRAFIPDFMDSAGQFGTSRGTFRGGMAANALSIGSGGGVEKKLGEIKSILEKINVNTADTVDAVEEIEEPTFD